MRPALFLVLVSGCTRHAATMSAPLVADEGQVGRIHWEQHVTGGAAATDKLPMIVALHGLGGDPERFGHVLDGFDARARIVLLRGPYPFNYGHAWWTIDKALMADGPLEGDLTGDAIAAAADEAANAIAELTHTLPTSGAPIVVGFSQGGAMSFAIATRHPTLVSAAFPLSGWLPKKLRSPANDAGTLPPIVAFHGSADPIVPLAVDEATASALKAAGFSVELNVLPYEKHTVGPAERAELQRRLARALQ